MKRLNIYLLDRNPLLNECWNNHLKSATEALGVLIGNSAPRYHIIQNTIESFLAGNCSDFATAIVTPTNSLSYMGAGFDRHLVESLLIGTGINDYKVLERLLQEHHLCANEGLLPLHSVKPIPIRELCSKSEVHLHNATVCRNWNIEWIISVPTMVVPSKMGSASELFHSMWEVMTRVKNDMSTVRNIFIPGIGTGYGGLREDAVARVIIGATLINQLQVSGIDRRVSQLKKSVLVLFLLRQDYRKFEIGLDIKELETHITDYGKNKVLEEGFEMEDFMDWHELAKCVVL